MTDLLLKLYDLPDSAPYMAKLAQQGVVIRRARAYEKFQVVRWVGDTFGHGWAGECEAAFHRQPISCFIATAKGQITGFACHDCTCLDFFGPLGVAETHRKKGIGGALLLRSLHAMGELGYAYAIAGDGDRALGFYSRMLEVIEIPGSAEGFYADRLQVPERSG
jgi:GNAT superfamily N-acetyltransferase